MWKHGVIDCKISDLENKMQNKLDESTENRFEVRPIGFDTYEQDGEIKCVLAYAWRWRRKYA